MNEELTENSTCRLARAIIERHGISYPGAMEKLASFQLNLVCDEAIGGSVAMQAALLTAINTGKRAFHGGVHLTLPQDAPCLIPWPRKASLLDAACSLGAQPGKAQETDCIQTLYFFRPPNPAIGAQVVTASGWSGGVSPATSPVVLTNRVDFALGGVLAGALGVARAFLQVAGLQQPHAGKTIGASLWLPGEDWTSKEAGGPPLKYLPQKLWILGLGHLGQGNLWNIGLLPYSAPERALFLLQDFDRAVEANLGSGVLCTEASLNEYKCRVCARWLEQRGFGTKITERPFDERTVPGENEPFVALSGFDSVPPRRLLLKAGFDLVVESGIGGDLNDFDHILLHTFPGGAKKPEDIWGAVQPEKPRKSELVRAFQKDTTCGVVAETLAGKAISTAFVGAVAGALVVGEVLRGLHGGERCEFLRFQLRRDPHPTVVKLADDYQLRLARSGYVDAS